MTTPTRTHYAGPLLPLVVVDTRGRVVPNTEVTVKTLDGTLVPLYLDAHRTLAPHPYFTDADGNFAGFFAEPGQYRVSAGANPEVVTAAVIAAEEAEFIAKQEGPIGPEGPSGPVGPPGAPGTRRWKGHGPPGTIIGSSPGDEYLDLDSGDLYTLG